VTKLPCRCSQQRGVSANIGSGASPNGVERIARGPPSTMPSVEKISPNWLAARFTSGESNLSRCSTQRTSMPVSCSKDSKARRN
jgi:hypothetical protein